eukprot:TRINITY_DN8909_c0_g1_i1.p1 TRINITY_DN8909_c0_g1~~TRINITY_DN8909_c0_g1_i1.p1  ORF type:complete len:285 (+),score=32.33 TRINITY_DN8909_c0_g1_i1:117-971(+)
MGGGRGDGSIGRRVSDSHHVGDSAKRVTVPMPTTMEGLQAQAKRHFGGYGGGQHKMWHHGKVRMHHSDHVKDVKHDDVVVVHVEGGRRAPAEVHYSTHKSDYVRHPIQARTTPRASPRVMRSPVKLNGDSTYKMDYPAHEIKTPRPTQRQEARGSPVKFEGTTTNKTDFVKHNVPMRRAVSTPRCATSPVPFEGTTTYTNDFYARRHERRPATAPARREMQKIPFQGCSEYKQEYLKHSVPKKQHIHLEPRLYSRAHSDCNLGSPKSLTTYSDLSPMSEVDSSA